ncbi:RNA polymerase I associated factor, A49-like protein [Podospora didyma]|uniref:RNA polymerase I associated factor, A49-like protein n=1 Tax=Podospora didyma TaxID=330526 RepID=A0AAE0KEJ0_9PEZI|nr:RNA polymerase I associated factor, A49-like protein [Podospora didyma]
MAKDSTLEKRKRPEDGSSKEKKNKSAERNQQPTLAVTAHITKIMKPKISPPVVAVTPGIVLSDTKEFYAYNEENPAKRRKNGAATELLLHSFNQNMDYTARNERPRGAEPLLNSYLAIYDPISGDMQLIEAQKMVVRGTVRKQKASDEAMADRTQKQSMYDMRTELGEAFGTKKSKKAIRAVVENAITAPAGDKLANGDLAMVNSIRNSSKAMATREELQAVVDQARPVPRGNLDAEDIQDVYVASEIIGAELLNSIPVMDWQEKTKALQPIEVPSRFVANRIARVASNENAVERLKVMRYLLWLLILWGSVEKGRDRGTKTLANRGQLRYLLAPASDLVIESLRRKFTDNGVMRKTHIDLLMTHCCTFASIIDNFEVDTFDLREDLKLEQKQVNQYFQEIGAQIKVSKAGNKTRVIAKLALPLQFPQIRQGRQRK